MGEVEIDDAEGCYIKLIFGVIVLLSENFALSFSFCFPFVALVEDLVFKFVS